MAGKSWRNSPGKSQKGRGRGARRVSERGEETAPKLVRGKSMVYKWGKIKKFRKEA